ncbi:MAG: Crp/Fnr family transcriptional regulator [Vicinamibacteria bacterium]|nr:Crp/Fnr family transcriptional regulator [Vicinamibacteria bacterium]
MRRPAPGAKEVVIGQLAQVSFFTRLDGPTLDKLEAVAQTKQFPADMTVFFQDDPSDSLYVMLSGSAKIFQTSEDGKQRILKVLRKGEAFGELAMIEGQPRSASVQALEPSEMLVLTRKDFQAFCDKNPSVLWMLLQAFAERMRRMNEDVLDMSFRDVPYRVLRMLTQLVDRHGTSGPNGWTISMQMSVKDMASLVGSNAEIVGRLLDGFESDGLIKRDRASWIVPDPKALNRALEYAAQ